VLDQWDWSGSGLGLTSLSRKEVVIAGRAGKNLGSLTADPNWLEELLDIEADEVTVKLSTLASSSSSSDQGLQSSIFLLDLLLLLLLLLLEFCSPSFSSTPQGTVVGVLLASTAPAPPDTFNSRSRSRSPNERLSNTRCLSDKVAQQSRFLLNTSVF
jgi:hypothetical protein